MLLCRILGQQFGATSWRNLFSPSFCGLSAHSPSISTREDGGLECHIKAELSRALD